MLLGVIGVNRYPLYGSLYVFRPIWPCMQPPIEIPQYRHVNTTCCNIRSPCEFSYLQALCAKSCPQPDLTHNLLVEWPHIPTDTLQNLAESLPKIVNVVTPPKKGVTKYVNGVGLGTGCPTSSYI